MNVVGKRAKLLRGDYFWYISAFLVIVVILSFIVESSSVGKSPDALEWHSVIVAIRNFMLLGIIYIVTRKFGFKGGLVACLAVGLIVLPHVITETIIEGYHPEVLTEYAVVVPMGLVITVLVGALRQVENRVKDSEKRYHRLFETAQDAILILDGDSGKIIDANPFVKDLLGYTQEELTGKNLWEIGEIKDIPAGKLSYQDLHESGYKRWANLPIVSRDGKQISVEVVANAYQVDHKRIIQCNIRDMTVANLATEALKTLYDDLKVAQRLTKIGNWKWIIATNKVTWSDELCRINGWEPEVPVPPFAEMESFYTPDGWKQLSELVTKTFSTGEPYELELTQIRTDGTEITTFSRGEADYDAIGNIVSLHGTVQDITERRHAEEALRALENSYSQLLEKGNDGIVVLQDGLGKFANSKVLEMTGFSQKNDVLGKPFIDFVSPHYTELVMERYKRRFAGEEVPGRYEIEILNKDGSLIPVEVNASLVEYNGKPAVMAMIRDITEHKQTERYLEMGREILQILNEPGEFHSSINNVLKTLKTVTGFDAVGIRLKKGNDFPYFVQEGFSEDHLLTEYTLVERDRHGDICRDKDGNVKLECTCGLILSGKTDPSNPLFTKSGSVWTNDSFPILDIPPGDDPRYHPRNQCIHQGYASIALIPILSGEHIVGLIQLNDRQKGRLNITFIAVLEGIASNIGTALIRKQAEKTLRLQAELLDKESDSVYLHDFEGNFVYVNRAAYESHGYSKEELLKMKLGELGDQESTKLIAFRLKEMSEKGETTFIVNHLHKNGSLIPMEIHISAIEIDGKPMVMSIARDITERKKTQEQLIAQDRLVSIGQLVSGVAHEINNPITSVIGFSDLLLNRNLPDDIKADLKIINMEGQRAADIVRNLLTFSRQRSEGKVLADIQESIEKVLVLRKHEQTVSNINVTTHFAPDLPQIVASSSQLQQVFYNLIINAEYAMTEAHHGGTLTITTERVGGIVRVSITDDGPGISSENMNKLFTPFFSTKGIGKGTGLGLSISHGIITEHGGRIYAESKPGKGATFIVELPITKEQANGLRENDNTCG